MTPRAVRAVLLVAALTVISCGEGAGQLAEQAELAPSTVSQAVQSTNKVLILGSTVTGGLTSREAQVVAAAGVPTANIHIVPPEQWRTMTAEQFMAYRAIILGNASCESGEAAFQAAIDTRNKWGTIVDGNVAILGTDPVTNRTPRLVENAIRHVLDSMQGRTGMYISLGCAYQSAPANTGVTLLEPFGTFKIQGVPGCARAAHMFQMFPGFLSAGVQDSTLVGDGCAARSVFTAYPDRNFSFAAVARSSGGSAVPGEQLYTDYVMVPGAETPVAGAPYVLVRGAQNQGAGCGISDYVPSGEECDFGDSFNGQPASEGQDPLTTCSYSCHYNWCGDGFVDAAFGEECDNGVYNGRSWEASGNIGSCTASCKLPTHNPPPTIRPPVARCQNVTVVAEYTCGMPAGIDSGSYDPDNDLVGCTQSPAGPYGVGDTTVTLTCTDQRGQAASCSGVVTVLDRMAPVVTLAGPAQQTLECTRGGRYTDPGSSASDQCTGPKDVSITGTVELSPPGSHTLTYSATDAAGNTGTATRSVLVEDTLPPTVTLIGPTSLTVECNDPAYVDPGASANDQCDGPLSVVAINPARVGTPGSYSVSYESTDPAGNVGLSADSRTVTVRDTLPPQIQVLPGPSTIQCNGAPYQDPGATASDRCAGDLTLDINRTSNLDQSRSGQYTVTYRVADASGNVATAVRQLTVGPCATCINLRLNDYNLFLLEDYTGGHDVVGKVAAGGNITMEDFSVGHGQPDSDIANTLVAGGNLTLNRGGVWGHARYGGTYSTNPSVTYPRGSAAQGRPIDFAARFAELRSQSSQLASLPVNGSTRRENWGGVMMRGTSTNVNVFEVNASAFNGAVLWSIDAPAGSFVVVNIRGATANFGGFGIHFSGGINQHGVLFNFVDTTRINAQGFGFWGTVLAPYAHVEFHNGSFDGGMYAKSFNGNAEGHINPLHNRDICP
jgi:choice-of-anchor A domain-containing protein